MPMSRTESIIENQMLNRKIVYAINKAITQDVPQNMRENWLETNNRYRFVPGDYINDNLRKHVVKDDVDLISFNRYVWEGRILADHGNRVTYTVSTHQTLKTVIMKHRNRPHYLMTLLYAENGDCEGSPKQMTLGDISSDFKMNVFDIEVLEEDFDKIMQGSISRTDGYKHYIVAYTAKHHAIIKIELLLLDKDFAVVDQLNLIEYLTPDFASLTESQYEEEEDFEESKQELRPSLLKLRPGVKPALRAMEEKA